MGHILESRFGEHVHMLREQAGWSQEQLAARLQLAGHDMSRSTLAKIESGIRHVYLEDLFAFQRVFGISFDELLNIDEKKPVRQ